MTPIPEPYRDILGAETAALTTIGDDGLPHSTVVWFIHDDDGEIRMSLNTARRKVKDLRKRSACSLLIVDPETPYRYVDIRGHAAIEPDPDYAFADHLCAKYGGLDLRTIDQEGERRIVVSIPDAVVYAVDMRR